MDGLTVGRIVHYVLSEKDVNRIHASRAKQLPEDTPRGLQINHGNPVNLSDHDHVAMIIVAVFPNEFGTNEPGINGQVFLDGNDQLWVTSARYDEGKSPGSWHWIEKA
jgi:hypothetical protein